MNTPTKNLENDHIHIIRLTEVMQVIKENGTVNPDHIRKIVEIIRNYADGLHHAKEEDILFPEMGKKGFSANQGPVAVMLHEHVTGRGYVKGIEQNLEIYIKGEKNAASGIMENLENYAELLQNHISKENNVLFRMADQVLSSSEQEVISRRFREVEESRETGRKAEDYINEINILANIYNVK